VRRLGRVEREVVAGSKEVRRRDRVEREIVADSKEVRRLGRVEMEVAIYDRVMGPAGRNVPKEPVSATARLIHRKWVVGGMMQFVAFRPSLVDLRPKQPASHPCIGPIPCPRLIRAINNREGLPGRSASD